MGTHIGNMIRKAGVENRVQLTRVVTDLSQVKLLDEAVAPEPYALAPPRQGVKFRHMGTPTPPHLGQTGKTA